MSSQKAILGIALVLCAAVGVAVFLKSRGDASTTDRPVAIAAAPKTTPAPEPTEPSPSPTPEAEPSPTPALQAKADNAPTTAPAVLAEAPALADAPTSPAKSWQVALNLTAMDIWDAPVDLDPMLLMVYDQPSTVVLRQTIQPGAPVSFTLDQWTRRYAFHGKSEAMIVPKIVLELPEEPQEKPAEELAEGEGGGWLVSYDLDVINRRGGNPFGRGGNWGGNWGGGRGDESVMLSLNEGQEPVEFLSTSIREIEQTPEVTTGTLQLDLRVRTIPYGQLEVTVENLNAKLQEGETEGDLVRVKMGAVPNEPSAKIEQALLRPRGVWGNFSIKKGGESEFGGRGRQGSARARNYREAIDTFMTDRKAEISGDRVFFDALPPGQYAVRVISDDGRAGTTQTVEVHAGELTETKVSLANQATLNVKVVLNAYGDKRELEGAEVKAVLSNIYRGDDSNTEIAFAGNGDQESIVSAGAVTNGQGIVTTDNKGVATFTPLEPGEVDVQVSHEQYGTSKQLVHVAPDKTTETTIELYSEPAEVVVKLIGWENFEYPNATLRVERSKVGRMLSDSEQIQIEEPEISMELPLGTYRFLFQARPEGERRATPVSRSVEDFEIADPGPHEVVFHLPQFADVDVTVTRMGEPVANTTLMLNSTGWTGFDRTSDSQKTDDQGTARLRVPEGTYRITLRADQGGRWGRMQQVEEITVELTEPNVFNFEIGEQLDMILRATDATTGETLENPGRVSLLIADENAPTGFRPLWRRMSREGDGVFKFQELDIDTYRVQVIKQGYDLFLSDPIALDGSSALREHLLELEPNEGHGRISGRITARDGLPVHRATLGSLINDSGDSFFTPTSSNRDGSYSIPNLPEGVYIMEFYSNVFRGGSRDLLPHISEPIVVTADEATRHDFVMEPGGCVQVSVREPNNGETEGPPVPFVWLDLLDETGNSVYLDNMASYFQDPVTQSSGNFDWKPLPPGRYTVRGHRDGWTQVNPAQGIAVVEADKTTRVTIVMERVY